MDNIGNILKIVKNEKTPSYIFDIDDLKRRICSIKEILGDDINLCYSIKANPFLVLKIIDLVDKIEVCSPGELDICKAVEKTKGLRLINKVIYSGVNKSYENVLDAFEHNICEYTAESLKHIKIINKIASENNVILPVLLRLSSGNQFGMTIDDIEYIVSNRKKDFSNVDIVGIHYFAGTQRKSNEFKKQKKDLDILRKLNETIQSKYDFKLRKLEYGPGIPVGIFERQPEDEEQSQLKLFAELLKEETVWDEITIEMGRYIATKCGYYVTRVDDTKVVNNNNYAIVDGGINHVNYYGQIMGMNTPVVYHYNNDLQYVEGQTQEWKICGSLCTVNDFLIKSYMTETVEEGDYLVFGNIGAYSVTESMYLFLSRTMPKIIFMNENGEYEIARDFMESSIFNTPTA